MREKRERKTSERSKPTEKSSIRKSTDNKKSPRKDFKSSETSSYFDRKEKNKSSRFDDDKPRRSYDKDERKSSRFGEDKPKRSYNRDEKESFSSRNKFDDSSNKPRRSSDRFLKTSNKSESKRYLDESESKFKRTRKSDIKDLGYQEKSKSRLVEKNSIEDETRNTYIYGRHPVIEALQGTTPVNKVWIAEGTRDTDQIVEHAIEKSIPYKIVTKTKLSYLVGESTNHQGVVAEVAGKEYTEFHDLIELTKQKEVFFIVLDKVEDPHNLGAIIRTADAAGVDAIILPKHRAVGLTGIVTKSSAGALDRMKICRVPNLVQALEELKKSNVWIVGVDMEGKEIYSKANLKGSIALTVGGEGEGLTRLVKEHCDFTVKIPMNSVSNSLNVSVATAVVTFEIYRQKDFK